MIYFIFYFYLYIYLFIFLFLCLKTSQEAVIINTIMFKKS